jgi:hypothetical protein
MASSGTSRIDWRRSERRGSQPFRRSARVLREQIESGLSSREIARAWRYDVHAFAPARKEFLLY